MDFMHFEFTGGGCSMSRSATQASDTRLVVDCICCGCAPSRAGRGYRPELELLA